jgi:topoisomerase IA-like protein
MSNVYVDGRSSDKAVLFLAAAETLGLDPSVVRTTTNGYNVPDDVAKEAGFDADGKPLSERPKAEPAKKAVAKKAPAKKAAAKKTAAKKTAAKKAPSKPKGEE